MAQNQPAVVTDRSGRRGVLVPESPLLEDAETQVLVRLDDGQQLLVQKDALVAQENGAYRAPFSFSAALAHPSPDEEAVVIPVVEEELTVQKRAVTTGKVYIHKVVHEQEEVVDEPLVEEAVEIKRVPINRTLDEPATVRSEGDTTIVPVMEEVLVVEKRLVLKEEVHITKQRRETRDPQRFTTRHERVVVERADDSENNSQE